MPTLYHSDRSYASQKTRLFLAENNIAWQSHLIDLSKQEHLQPDYLKINPAGLVPAFQDGDKIIVNSTDIMQYVTDNYLADSAVDKSLAKTIFDFCKKDEGLHDPHMRTLSYYYLWMPRQQTPEEIERVLALAQTHPTKARGEFLAKAIQRQISEQQLILAKRSILIALDEMEQQLQSSQGFIFGDSYTMADAVATARIFRLTLLKFEPTLQQDYPATWHYYLQMRKRPSFQAANMVDRRA